MFAYCNNNPTGNSDTAGNLPRGILNPNPMGRDGGSSLRPISDLQRLRKQAKKRSNSSEEAVLYAEDYAFYKGSLVVRHSDDFLTSWSLFGVIFLNTDVKSSETLKHEYGHFLQERQYGSIKYISTVFYPSATYNGLSRLFPSLNHNYYNMPWEYDADMRGDVNRSHASWSGIISDIYFAVQRILP